MSDDLAAYRSQLRSLIARTPNAIKNAPATMGPWVESNFGWKYDRLTLAGGRTVLHGLPNIQVMYFDIADFKANFICHGKHHAQSLSFKLGGVSRLARGVKMREEVVAMPGQANNIIWSEDTVFEHDGDWQAVVVRVADRALLNKFEGLLHKSVGKVNFDPVSDFMQNRSRLLLQQLLQWGTAISGDEYKSIATPLWHAEFEQTLLSHLVLHAPHNHRDLLMQPVASAAPKNVVRAEAYIRANVSSVLVLEQIAEAAGCSPRALQKAFFRFRGITPMGFVRQVRYEAARERLARGQVESVLTVVRDLGFSNAGRFAVEFKKQFGRSPTEILRAGGA